MNRCENKEGECFNSWVETMISVSEKIKRINEVVARDRNVWNEYFWDFWVCEVMIWDILDYFAETLPGKWLKLRSVKKEIPLYWRDIINTRNMTHSWYEINKDFLAEIYYIRGDKRLPIQSQKQSCIDFIYNLTCLT